MRNYAKITPEGTKDLLFEECIAKEKAQKLLSALFSSRGYKKVITPTLEFYDLFNRESSGLHAENLYKLTDTSGRLLVMRPDSTLPIARIAATRLRGDTIPLRLYYHQNVFINRPSYAGHSDETSQSGIELIGAVGIRADLEVITTAVDALNSCGIPDYRIEIGHAGFFKSLCRRINANEESVAEISKLIEAKNYVALNDLIDKFEDSDVTRAIKRLPALFGSAEVIDEAESFAETDEEKQTLSYLRSVYTKLVQMGLEDKISIDLGLVHRGNYYTGIVFRGYIAGSGKTVLSGGRYDSLIAELGEALPGAGFGMETDALAAAMLAMGSIRPPKSADVLVFGADGFEADALIESAKLCAQGLICENAVFSSIEEAAAYAAERGISRIVELTACGMKERTMFP